MAAPETKVTFCVRGVISPALSNVYLHEVLAQWFEHEVKPRLRGRAFEVRYADDAVLVYEREDDARRVLGVLAKRLQKYGLRLHPDKTRMVELSQSVEIEAGRLAARAQLRDVGVSPTTGDAPGRSDGSSKRKTAKDRFSRALKGIGHWCRTHRHWSLRDQQAGVEPQAAGSLRVLRNHRQRDGVEPVPNRGHTTVAQVARPAELERAHVMGTIHASARYLSPPACARGAQCVPLSSEAIVRRAVCLNWARTDPWEPRVGNCPRPPGHKPRHVDLVR